jgi:hypothetical protein
MYTCGPPFAALLQDAALPAIEKGTGRALCVNYFVAKSKSLKKLPSFFLLNSLDL